VAGIRCRLQGITTAERHHERPTEGDRDPLQGIEVGRPDAALDPAFDHPSEPGPCREFDPGPATPFPDRLDLGADAGLLLTAAAFRLERQSGSSDTGHDRVMFIRGPSLPLI
jgi:hypothetical protein